MERRLLLRPDRHDVGRSGVAWSRSLSHKPCAVSTWCSRSELSQEERFKASANALSGFAFLHDRPLGLKIPRERDELL